MTCEDSDLEAVADIDATNASFCPSMALFVMPIVVSLPEEDDIDSWVSAWR